tara:strand:- start:23048 stop:23887 length:840 start_codon:yes stop_codon:yes gene_type:complete
MKNTIIYCLIASTSLFSCTEQVDKKSIYKRSIELMTVFSQGDTNTILKHHFPYVDQSNEMFGLEKTRIDKDIIDVLSNKPSIVQIDTSGRGYMGDYEASIVVKEDTNYFEIIFWLYRDSVDNLYLRRADLKSLNEDCYAHFNFPHVPEESVIFKRLSWQTDILRTSFNSGQIMIQNNDSIDYSFLRFRLKIGEPDFYINIPKFKNLKFNQTIEISQKVRAGDLVLVDIPELKDYWYEIEINKTNVLWEAELLEALPRPEYEECTFLDQIRKKTLIDCTY